MGPKGAHEGAAPPSLGGGVRVWGGEAHLGRRPPPFGRRPPSPLPPINSGGVGGGEHTQGAAPPSLHSPPLPPTLSLLRIRVTPTIGVARFSLELHNTHAVVLPVCRAEGDLLPQPRLDRGRETSSLPDVYEYSGTPLVRTSGVVRGASRP